MFQVGKNQVEGQISSAVYAGAKAQTHGAIPLVTLKKLIDLTFVGDINYAAGFTLFQFAWHVLLPGAIAGMILGPLTAQWARRRPARTSLIVGMAILVATFIGLVFAHDSWVPYVIFFVLGSIASGIYYGIAPNLLVDVIPPKQQGINAGLMAGLGSIGASFATAGFTAIQISHQFGFTLMEPKGPGGTMIPVPNSIPQVYTASGYTWVFVMAAAGAAVALLLSIVLRAGRTPLQGGLVD
jgi:MFS family permease